MNELRFRAFEHVDVQDVMAIKVGVNRIIGKRLDASGKAVVDDDFGLLRLSPQDMSELRPMLRKCVQKGELACADAATAQALGLPFKE